MYSEKAKKHAEACRFCWMCRHLCPVGQKTGKEANTPRAKGLLVAMEQRGFPMDGDTAETMYECLLCGACTNDCVTGFDPLLYIREARTQAIVNELAPQSIRNALNRVLETGNVFGMEERAVALQDAPEKAETLVYLGNTASYKTPQIAQALLSLLKKAGVSFAVLKDEPKSGAELGDLLGYVEEVRQAAKACAMEVNSTGAKMLVVLDSYDAAFMKHEYAEWGIQLMPEVVTATSFVAGLVKDGRLSPEKQEGIVTYHDGSRLARDLDEHRPPRSLIEAMGFNLAEMFLNRRLAKCCGATVFGEYAPGLVRMTAQGRWEDAKRTAAKTLVTACPQSYLALSGEVPDGYLLKDVFVMLDASVK